MKDQVKSVINCQRDLIYQSLNGRRGRDKDNNRNFHPFDCHATESLLNEVKNSIQDIYSIVESSKRIIEASPQREQPLRGRGKTNFESSPSTRYRVQASPQRLSHGTSTTINFNISCSLSLDEEDEDRRKIEFQASPPRHKNQSHSPEARVNFASTNPTTVKKESPSHFPITNVADSKIIEEAQSTIIKESALSPKKSSNLNHKVEDRQIISFSNLDRSFRIEGRKGEERDKNSQLQAFRKKQKKGQQKEGDRVSLSGPPDVEQFMLTEEERQSLNNTCTKNELENILSLSRRDKSMMENKLLASAKNVKKWNSNLHPNANKTLNSLIESEKKSIIKSSSPTMKSPAKANKDKEKITTPKKVKSPSNVGSTNKRNNYIEKFVRKIESKPSNYVCTPGKRSKHGTASNCKSISPVNKESRSPKYDHPTKSPKNISKIKIEQSVLNKHLETPKECWDREFFIESMYKQCYVQRFLSREELSGIYEQFYHQKVQKYLWEEKVIQKIFNKIHMADELI